MKSIDALSRRRFLQGVVALPLLQDHGQIEPPVPVPDILLRLHDGTSLTLPELVKKHVTAVQLMFTACTTTCPMEAAIFAQVQKQIPHLNKGGMQLLSLSVNPASDNSQALSNWRHRFHAGPAWTAAAPMSGGDAALKAFFQGSVDRFSDHSTQVSILDTNGYLVWRTSELPSAQEVSSILRRVRSARIDRSL